MIGRRVRITRTNSGPICEGRGEKVDESTDSIDAMEMPHVRLPDLKPGEGLRITVCLWRPFDVTPGSKLYAALALASEAIRTVHDDGWESLSPGQRELFEKAAAAVR